MRERVERLLRESPAYARPAFEPERMPFIATFHSLGLFIIKDNYRALGFKRFPVVFDRSDSLRAMKEALRSTGREGEFEARMMLAVASRSKGEGISVTEFIDRAEDARTRRIGEVWQAYERSLAGEGALDFDDLLLRAVTFLKVNEE